MSRYYLGLDWGDKAHMVWVGTEAGQKVVQMKVEQSFEGMSQFARWLNECEAAGIEMWAAIERPEGRIVDFLLDHGGWSMRLTRRRWIGPGIGFAPAGPRAMGLTPGCWPSLCGPIMFT